MKQIMSTEAIKEKLENEAPVVVANDHVYWYFYNDECENELIIQSVRLSVYQQTRSVREMLLARAMSSSLMVDEQKAHEAK